MQHLEDLISRLDRLNVTLRDDEGYLDYSAPEGVVTPALLDELRAHKDELLALLRQGRGAARHHELRSRPHGGTLPVSSAQRGLWFLSQLAGANVAYNMPFVTVLAGPLDTGALSRGIIEIVRRHDSLRTTFRLEAGGPVQVIHAPAPLAIPIDDLCGLDPAARAAELLRIIDGEVHGAFDIERGPLIRARILRTAASEHVLCLVIHHIVCDGWSMGVFARELAALYGAFVAGKPSPLPELPLQYADASRWQEERFSGSAGEHHRAYWRGKLADLPLIDLPTDRPRPAVESFRGDHHHVRIDGELTRALRALGRDAGTTLYVTLLAAWSVLLAHYSGQDDIAVSSATANRTHPATEGLIGYFVNTLVRRCDLSGNPTFEALLSRVWAQVMADTEHEELPFARVVEDLRPERNAGHSPLAQVAFSLQGSIDTTLTLPGIRTSPWDKSSFRTAKLDLTLLVAEVDGGLSAVFEYNADLFTRATIERMGVHYETLLREVVRDRTRPIGSLALLDDDQRRQLLAWSGTNASFDAEACIHQLFEAYADRAPDAIALVDRCSTPGSTPGSTLGSGAAPGQAVALTYRELDQRANQVAHHLVRLGVGPEVRVGLCLPRSAELVIALLGILKAGGAFVVLDPEHPRQRLAFLLEDTAVPVLVTHRSLVASLPQTRARIVEFDRRFDEEPTHRPPRRVTAGNLAYVLYTSGSTGDPNGVLIEHRGLVNAIEAHMRLREVGPGARQVHVLSFNFDGGISHLFAMICGGGTLYLVPRDSQFLASGLVELMEREAITHASMPPTMLAALPHAALPALHTVSVGGERCSAELVARWGQKRRMINMYGPTEVSIVATAARCVPDGNPPSIGRPIPNVHAYVVDRWGQLAPLGVIGELWLGGVGVARGYLNRPELTARKFIDNPFQGGTRDPSRARLYRTGDLVRYRKVDDGPPVIEFIGRADSQVKLRGYRVELSEVESALRASPRVRDAVVTFHAGSVTGYVVPAAPEIAAQRALTAEFGRELRAALPPHLVPTTIVVLAALPLTLNGKVDLRALPPPEASREQQAEPEEPRTDAERKLAEVWCKVLGLARVGIHENFFNLGGDSVRSIQIISKAQEVGIALRTAQLFENPTIAQLAAAAGSEIASAEQGAVKGPVPLTPIQRWFFAQELPSPSHGNQAVVLETPADLDPARLRQALVHVQTHHDALRTRFTRHGQTWAQDCLAAQGEALLEVVDLSSLAPEAQRAAMAETAARLQASLDLSAGPVMQVAAFRLGDGRPGRLLWIIHHLVVDAVSWQVLLPDLGTAYRQLAAGQPVALAVKTTSFQRWAERLTEYARGQAFAYERASLASGAVDPAKPLPVDRPRGPDGRDRRNLQASAAVVRVQLSREETQRLTRDALRPYNLGVQDVLLAAVAEVVARWTGSSGVWIDLEGHGREDLFDDVDLSRTVGWFTSLVPVRLVVTEGDPAEALVAIKEQLRAIPHHGIGYGLLRYLHDEGATLDWPRPEISFNYLGHVGSDADTGSEVDGFRLTWDDAGPLWAADGPRSHVLQINGMVAGDRLEVSFAYSRDLHDAATVERLANEFALAVGRLVNHCLSLHAGAPGAAGEAGEANTTGWGGMWTPSDFPLGGLGRAELAGLLDRLGETNKSKIEAIYALTPLQAGMLFHARHDEAHAAYTTQLALTLEGALDVAALRSAWEAALRRHALLRSRFVWEGMSTPVQVILREAALPWDERDWRGAPPEPPEPDDASTSAPDLDARLTALGHELVARPITLDATPMLRLTLVRTAEQRHVLFWDSHHLLMDGWSIPVLLREVFEDYLSAVRKLPPRARRTGSYESYLRFVGRQDRARSEAYWQDALRGFDAATPLVLERARPAEQRGYRQHVVRLDAALTARLVAAAEAERVTLATVIEGVWALFLSRTTGLSDVLFGTVVSGRDARVPGIEDMVGLFIQTLPVRVQVDEASELWPWLRALQADSTAMREHQYTPLAQLQQIAGIPAGSHLFRSMVVFQNYPIDASSLDGSGLRVTYRSGSDPTHYPLVVTGSVGQALQIAFDYDLAGFDPASIDRMAGHLAQILRGMAGSPAPRLAELSLLTYAERAQVVVAWNQTALAHDKFRSIHALFEAQAVRVPDAPAVYFADRVVSYAELNRRANRLARYLRRMGVAAETRVGICVDRSDDLIVSLFAVLKSGGAYVPLDPAYPPARLSLMVADAGAAMIVTKGDLCDWLADPLVGLVELDHSADAIAAEDDHDLPDPVAPEQLAYLIYTSGSTGQPKGVAIEHRNTVAMLHAALTQYTAEDLQGVSACASICFDYSILEIFVPLIAGGAIIVADGALALPHAPARDRVKLFSAVPSAMAALLAAGTLPRSIRAINLAGERLSNALVQQVYQVPGIERVYNIYGPTETTTYSTYALTQHGASHEPTLGRPIANTQVYLLDQRRQPVPVGIPGEIYIGGEGVSRGYWNRPELTAERFLDNPFGPGRIYKTGDLGCFRPDGEIDYLGRIDHQIKLRGFRVELGEIEAMLERIAVVDKAAVVVQGEPPHQQLVAYWVAAPAAAEVDDAGDADAAHAAGGADAEALRAQLAGTLPEFMVPEIYVRLDAFPLTASGKLDRRALRPPEDSDLRRGEFRAPEPGTEQALAAIWRDVLGVARVGAHDNFFDLGGHSLLALTMVGRVEAELGRSIPLATLFEAPTLRGLARWLAAPETGAPKAHPLVIPFQTQGRRTPVFCVGGFGVHVSYLHALAPALGADQPFYGLQLLDTQADMPDVDRLEILAARFADIVQEIQPQGPYVLGGHSAGARVALAIAFVLRARGHETALAVLDMDAPVAGEEGRWDLDVSLMNYARYIWEIQQRMGDPIALDLEALARMPQDDRQTWQHVAGILQAKHLLPPGDGVALLQHMIRLRQRVFQMLQDYMPEEPYPGQLVLLLVANRHVPGTFRVPVEGWQKISARPVEAVLVPGDHMSMIREPHVRAVAEHLRRLVDAHPAAFSVTWDTPEEAQSMWLFDEAHSAAPMTPLDFDLRMRPMVAGINRANELYGLPFQSEPKLIHAFVYQKVIAPDVPAETLPSLLHASDAAVRRAGGELASRWEAVWLPEIQAHLAQLDAADPRGVTLPVLLGQLAELTGRVARLWELHFELLSPVLVALLDFEDAYRDLFPGATALDVYDLLAGFPNKTVEANLALWRIGRAAARTPALHALLIGSPLADLPAALAHSPEGRALWSDLEAYARVYGERSDDLYLDTPTWVEDLTPVLRGLREAVCQPERDLAAELQHQAERREARLRDVRAQLASHPRPVVEEFEALLGAAQVGTQLSEDHNFWIDCKITYHARRVSLEIGKRLSERGAIDQPGDVFYLTRAELLAQGDLDAAAPALRDRIAERRADAARFAGTTPPAMLGARSAVVPSDCAILRATAKFNGSWTSTAGEPGDLRGMPGARGKVTGPVRIVRTLDEAHTLVRGDILVAPATLPSWTPLFATAAAVVTNVGGILCHAAVVAREYGIPAVVGAQRATESLRDGQIVEVDGDAGTVRLVAHRP